MWKFDYEDAYKNVPAQPKDLRLQGFCWLGAYFIELKQMFGSAASVQNFDVLGNTIKSCCLANCDIPSKLVHRQLDDVPVVAPQNSTWGEQFETEYRKLCEKIGMVLAPDCKKFEKAFSNSFYGKVLGFFFNTKTLTWSLPAEKLEKVLSVIVEIENKEKVCILDMQKLLGNLNHVSQLCPFLLNFKFNLNKTLSTFNSDSDLVELSVNAKEEMAVWKGFLLDENKWYPICHPQHPPPICTKTFFSDAAGFAKKSIWKGNIGCAVVGLNEESDTILAYQMWWPKSFVTEKTDSCGSRFGNKTSTLEQIGLLLPFLLIPEKLSNQHIVLNTDNIACVFGHYNHLMKGDECASIFIKTVHLISAFLGSQVHVQHSPRRSDWGSKMADNLTRECTTGFLESRMIQRWSNLAIPSALDQWLLNPTEDWNLPFVLLNEVTRKVKK
jgi:hypothetical protein